MFILDSFRYILPKLFAIKDNFTHMTTNKILSNLIKKYGLNVLELERLTGVPSSTIYRIVNNKAGNPTIEVLKKLSSFFQITVSQLIGEESIGHNQVTVIPVEDISEFINNNFLTKTSYNSIPVELPLSTKCFATYACDSLMEPFILKNSLIIIDPDKELVTKDFAFLLKSQQNTPKIRQVIKNDETIYLKVLNNEYALPLEELDSDNYAFIGSIVHYRTNLLTTHDTVFNLDTKQFSPHTVEQK